MFYQRLPEVRVKFIGCDEEKRRPISAPPILETPPDMRRFRHPFRILSVQFAPVVAPDVDCSELTAIEYRNMLERLSCKIHNRYGSA